MITVSLCERIGELGSFFPFPSDLEQLRPGDTPANCLRGDNSVTWSRNGSISGFKGVKDAGKRREYLARRTIATNNALF